jgi:hypothetical protein
MGSCDVARLWVCWRKPCRPACAVTTDPEAVSCPHCLSARLWDDLAMIITRLRLSAG